MRSTTQKKQRRIVIGDVHGHYDGLMVLLEEIAPSQSDQVYFLGDLIDRGPQSAQVVKFVKNSPYQCLLGNHEKMMVNAFPAEGVNASAWQAWLYSGGQATVASYIETSIIPQEDLMWMRSLPLYIDLGDIWLVHAGLDPTRPIHQQNSDQFCWIRKEFHGMAQPYFSDKLIITGHTMTFTFEGVAPGELAQGKGWLDIDTGAYHPKSRWLTGLDLDNWQVYQVNMADHQVRVLPFQELVKPVAFDVETPVHSSSFGLKFKQLLSRAVPKASH